MRATRGERSARALFPNVLHLYPASYRDEYGREMTLVLLDIAFDCGFQNHETFTHAFRRRCGMPPSSYRAWVRTQAQQRHR